MAIEIVTKEDLQQFKADLFNELKQLLKSPSAQPVKQWLKSYEVRQMLGISRGTLQTLHINGTLKASKVGGLMFYAYEDIAKLMQGQNKTARNK
ncbi:MAG: helix-turn-helix domain-containing protein [Sphingobacteriia bacterium]|nr:helix-turn-helix domain-containing protein [Sphingobacteriia bacterium]